MFGFRQLLRPQKVWKSYEFRQRIPIIVKYFTVLALVVQKALEAGAAIESALDLTPKSQIRFQDLTTCMCQKHLVYSKHLLLVSKSSFFWECSFFSNCIFFFKVNTYFMRTVQYKRASLFEILPNTYGSPPWPLPAAALPDGPPWGAPMHTWRRMHEYFDRSWQCAQQSLCKKHHD